MKERNFRIIVVDDEPETASMIADMASMSGHEVVSFDDPYKALQSFLKTPSDIVITDLSMPHIDGFEMIKCMRERSNSTEFIVVTGNKTIKTVFHSRGLGVNKLFFKPVKMEELLEAIEESYKRATYWVEKLHEVKDSSEIRDTNLIV
ncbi:MAG: response regulator [Desulfobacterales bacterium]|nr:response regulator [Desulfobacterales bacterium]